jgi:CheY-like chemotaxis protein
VWFEALELMRRTPHAFDLLITDSTMPGMTGVDLADAVHRVRRDLPTILLTGYTVGLTLERLQPVGVCALLSKPQTLASLATAVGQALKRITPP